MRREEGCGKVTHYQFPSPLAEASCPQKGRGEGPSLNRVICDLSKRKVHSFLTNGEQSLVHYNYLVLTPESTLDY